ncbi:MAG: iron ABC transporter permease [Planctomycetota bacterium]|nr:iron ABC transporter permease [Planctomycetota bacterium]
MSKPVYLVVIAWLILAITSVASLFVGAITISPWDALEFLLRDENGLLSTERTILFELRLPRMITAILVGSSLGIAGVGFQSLFRNPLADPYIIGASSGAALGVTIAIMVGWQATLFGLRTTAVAALLGSLLIVAIVMVIGSLSQRSNSLSLLLAGVALSSMINSIVSLLMFWSEEKIMVIFAWLMGSLANNGWPSIASTSLIALVGLVLLWGLSRPLDSYLLGDVASQSLGLNLTWFRLLLVAGASIATGAAVSSAGIIGFVGLIAPHMARWTVGPKHVWLIPMSACYGAMILIAADSIARTIVAPTELPVGSITALMGCPFFLGLLLFRSRSSSFLGEAS